MSRTFRKGKGTRFLAVILSILVIGTILPSCSQKNESKNTPTPDTTNKDTTKKESGKLTEKEVEIKVMIGEHPSYPVKQYQDSAFLKYIAETTGIKLNMMAVPDANDTYKTKLNILLNTNEIPDIIWTSSNDSVINSMALKGAFLSYTDNLQYTPNIKKLLDSNPDIRRSFVATDGKLYIMPRVTPNVMSEIFIAREDIMKKENITEPQNYDELYNMLKTLKAKYPDYTTFINRNGSEHLVNRLAYSWGTGYEPTTFGMYLNRDTDKYQYGPQDPNFKNMVSWIKKLYDEKILDPDYALKTTKQWEEVFTNGKALFAIDYIDRIKTINDGYINSNNSARVVAINPPKGSTGKSGIIAKASAMGNSGIVVSAKTKDTVAAVKFVDWVYSDKGRLATHYGIEGETYTLDKDGKPSLAAQMKRQANPTGKDPVKDFGWVYYMDKYEFPAGYLKPVTGDPAEADNRWMFSREKMEKAKGVISAEPVIGFNDEQTKVLRSKGTVISDYFKQNIDKFIMGARPMSEWGKFVDEVNKLGVNDLMKTYNDAYTEYKKK